MKATMRNGRMSIWAATVWAAASALPTGGAWAQTMDLQGGELPLAIDAKGGIEWRQDEKVFIAKGPAQASRGDVSIFGDELRAYYRDGQGGKQGGKSEVTRMDAIGNVKIVAPGRVATGGHAVYDVDKSVIVLKDGHPVTLTSGADIVTADQQMEFWDQRNLAVARGGATAVRGDKRIEADVLTATFVDTPAGKSEIDLIEAFDNVRIYTSLDQVYADRAAYNVPTGLARLTGSVKIKRGANEINGCSADIDLNTGISRLNSCEGASVTGKTGQATPGQGGVGQGGAGRVHGILAPKAK